MLMLVIDPKANYQHQHISSNFWYYDEKGKYIFQRKSYFK